MSDEIPGAQEQLERDGTSLRAQILELARELTPEQLPDIVLPTPSTVDWHEPLQYQYRVSDRIQRAVELNTPEFIDRAAAVLTDRGWAIERGSTEVPGSTPMIHVAGSRNGFRIMVRVQEGYPGVLYVGETAPRPLYTPETFVPPPPEKTAETVDPGYVLCYECQGRGWCPLCQGRGWVTGDDGRETCPECHGLLGCPICDGRGQLVITELDTWERRLYPELGTP